MQKPIKSDGQSLLFGLLIKKKSPSGKAYIQFQWFRIGLLFTSFLIISWLLAGVTLYSFFKYYRDYDAVKFTDMLILPFIIKQHRIEMGNFHVKQGLNALEKENYAEGIHLLKLGLARSPANLEGRITLAQIYEYGIKRKDIAADIYLEGFKYQGIEDEAFLIAALQCLLNNQRDAEIQALAEEFLPSDFKTGDNRNFQTLAFATATSYFLNGNFDKAEDYINLFLLNSTVDGVILSAKISWDRGNHLSAINKLERTLSTFPDSNAIFSQLGIFYRKIKDFDAARRYTQLRNVKNPSDPMPIIDLMYLYNDTEDLASVKDLSNRILRDFENDKNAIYQLANFASLTGNIRLAQRCYELVLEKGFELDKLALTVIESYLVARDYEGAMEFAEELLEENPTWLNAQKALFNSLRALAAFGLNRPEIGEIYLGEFLNKTDINSAIFVAVAKRFSDNNMLLQAQKVLQKAYQFEPRNQRVLNDLIEVNLNLGLTKDLSLQLRQFLNTRRPSKKLLAQAYTRLGSDLFLFTENRRAILIELGSILRENKL